MTDTFPLDSQLDFQVDENFDGPVVSDEELMSFSGEAGPGVLTREGEIWKASRLALASGITTSEAQDVYRTRVEEDIRATLADEEKTRAFNERARMVVELGGAGVLTPDEMTGVLSQESEVDPSTIIERKTAEALVSAGVYFNPNPAAEAAIKEDPEVADAIINKTEEMLAKGQYVQNLITDMSERWEKISGVEGFVKSALSYVPLFEGSFLTGASSEIADDVQDNAFFTDTSLVNQREDFMLRPLDEATALVKATAESIFEWSPPTAIRYLQAMNDFPADDRFWARAFDVIDIADMATLGAVTKPVRAMGRTLGGANKRLLRTGIGLARAARRPSVTSSGVAGAHGDGVSGVATHVDEMLRQRVNGLRDDFGAVFPVDQIKEFFEVSPSLFRPGDFYVDVGRASPDDIRIMKEASTQNSLDFLDALGDVAQVQGRGSDAIAQAVAETLEKFKRRNPGDVNRNILDARYATPENSSFSNTALAEIRIGYEGKYLTGVDADEAHATFMSLNESVYRLDPESFTIKQDGDNYYMSVTKPIDESSHVYQQTLASESPTPLSFQNMFFSAIRATDGLVGEAFKQDAKVSASALNETHRLVESMAKRRIGKLSRKEIDKLEKFAAAERIKPVMDGQGRHVSTGVFHRTAGRFERAYEKQVGEWPSFAQVQAYDDYVKAHDFQASLMDHNLLRDKSRVGIERHRLKVSGSELESDGIARLVDTDDIEGKALDIEETSVFLKRTDDPRVLIHDPVNVDADGRVTSTLKKQSEMSEQEWKDLFTNFYDNDGVLLELNTFGQRDAETVFKDLLGGDAPDFILAKRVNTLPLTLKQVNRNPGGHHMYQPTGSFIKIANMVNVDGGGVRYKGDLALLNTAHHKQAVEIAEKIEAARKALVRILAGEGTEAELRAHLKDTPFTVDRFKGMYEPDPETGEVFANINAPVIATRHGESTTDVFDYKANFEGFRNSSEQSRLDKGLNLSFASKQSKTQIETVVGSEAAPYVNAAPADLVMPFAALEKSMSQLAKGRHFDDLKFRTVDRFLGEFGDMLKGGIEEARLNPIDAVLNATFSKEAIKVGGPRLKAARNQVSTLRRLINVESDLQKTIRHVHQKLADTLFNVGGERAFKLLPESALPMMQDPTAYMRNVAFHAHMGVFNPVQLFKQAQSFANTMGLAGPAITLKAAPGAIQMVRLGFTRNKGIINAMADNMANMGGPFSWKKEDFLEAYEAMTRTGWLHVGGNVGSRDFMGNVSIRESAKRKFLSKGTIFFDTGERFNRATAYTAAYQKWRQANPNAKFTRAVQDKVFADADDFAGNMTSFSNAAWQRGFTSPMTQFFGYSARIAEQMLPGVRHFTTAQKARVFAVYSALYGVPIATSAAFALPLYDELRDRLVAEGLDAPSNAVMETLQEGFIGLLAGLVNNGKMTNVSELYGPAGLIIFKDVAEGNKDWYDIVGGVSGSLAADIFKSFDGLGTWLINAATGSHEDFPLSFHDFRDALQNVTTVSAAVRAYYMFTAGQYITRHGIEVTDKEFSELDAVINFSSGVITREVSDTFRKVNIAKLERQARNDLEKDIKEEYRRGYAAMENKEYVSAKEHFTRAATMIRLGNYTFDEQVRIATDVKGGPSLVDQVGSNFSFDGLKRGDDSRLKSLARQKQKE